MLLKGASQYKYRNKDELFDLVKSLNVVKRKGGEERPTTNRRLPNTETEIARWKFVMVFSREPKGERSRKGKGKREETKSVESCLRDTCKLEQSQILASC